jgi:hypothetical protein
VRAITAVYVNAIGFHSAALLQDAVRLSALTELLTASVVEVVAEEKGVVDSFHGDRFLLSFNAASSCATHALRGARCALRIGQRLDVGGTVLRRAGWPTLRITAGAASGPARCGTLGSAGAMRFSMIGAPVPQAAALEQLCRRHPREVHWRHPATVRNLSGAPTHTVAGNIGPSVVPYRVLVSHSMLDDIQSQITVECVDITKLPIANTQALQKTLQAAGGSHARLPGVPTSFVVASQLLGERSMKGDDEWMYTLDGPTSQPSSPLGGSSAVPAQVQLLLSLDANAIRLRQDAAAVAVRRGFSGSGGHLPEAASTSFSRRPPHHGRSMRAVVNGGGLGSPFEAHIKCGEGEGNDGHSSTTPLPLHTANAAFMIIHAVLRIGEQPPTTLATTIACGAADGIPGPTVTPGGVHATSVSATATPPGCTTHELSGSSGAPTPRQAQEVLRGGVSPRKQQSPGGGHQPPNTSFTAAGSVKFAMIAAAQAARENLRGGGRHHHHSATTGHDTSLRSPIAGEEVTPPTISPRAVGLPPVVAVGPGTPTTVVTAFSPSAAQSPMTEFPPCRGQSSPATMHVPIAPIAPHHHTTSPRLVTPHSPYSPHHLPVATPPSNSPPMTTLLLPNDIAHANAHHVSSLNSHNSPSPPVHLQQSSNVSGGANNNAGTGHGSPADGGATSTPAWGSTANNNRSPRDTRSASPHTVAMTARMNGNPLDAHDVSLTGPTGSAAPGMGALPLAVAQHRATFLELLKGADKDDPGVRYLQHRMDEALQQWGVPIGHTTTPMGFEV